MLQICPSPAEIPKRSNVVSKREYRYTVLLRRWNGVYSVFVNRMIPYSTQIFLKTADANYGALSVRTFPGRP